MAWLARSLANSLRIDDDDDDVDGDNHIASTSSSPSQTTSHQRCEEEEEECKDEDGDEIYTHGRGVREDLSELKETLSRQLWGVASFLAPSPHDRNDGSVSDWNRSERSHQSLFCHDSDADDSESVGISDVRADFVEIGGRFTSAESNFGSDDRDLLIGDAVGITDEVLAFASNIAMHPETWLDFPLSEDEDADGMWFLDFEMSDAQQEHAWAVERLSPRLAALRIEFCPAHMSEGYFWKVYFVLLHSRLNKHDAQLLSTPQVVAARATWMQELQKRTKSESEWSLRSPLYSKTNHEDDYLPTSSHNHYENPQLSGFGFEAPDVETEKHTSSHNHYENPQLSRFGFEAPDVETEKHPVISSDMRVVDKSVIQEIPVSMTSDKILTTGSSSKQLLHNFDDDDEDDDWLRDENLEFDNCRSAIPVGNEDDVSFSDLEDDDCTMPVKHNLDSKGIDTPRKQL